jgi:NADH oxidase (H2O-forming)
MTTKNNQTQSITDDVKWIGIHDYHIRTFDIVMRTDYGTTYNSYFINAEKKAIVEVAKAKFTDEYIEKIRSVTDPTEIKYIILDHTEPDHSGCLSRILRLSPDATVVGSGNAIRYLEDIINMPFKSLVVKDGDTLDLGNKTLKFISAPNLHWPDSIYTYLQEDKILFTCDSFGAHYCSPELYSSFTSEYADAYKYYFDVILKPFSRFMLKAVDRIRNLEINYLCTGHGPVHSENKDRAIDLAESYAIQYLHDTARKENKNILIAYVSAYGYTKEAAEIIAEGIKETENCTADLADIENMPPDELEARLIKADGLLIGSPTINQNTLLPVYKMFALIIPFRDRVKLGGAFGSYGWSGEATSIILENLRLLKMKIFEEIPSFKFSPGGNKRDMLKEFGRKFSRKLIEECGE